MGGGRTIAANIHQSSGATLFITKNLVYARNRTCVGPMSVFTRPRFLRPAVVPGALVLTKTHATPNTVVRTMKSSVPRSLVPKASAALSWILRFGVMWTILPSVRVRVLLHVGVVTGRTLAEGKQNMIKEVMNA